MSNLTPVCASVNDLYDLYISNNKDIAKEELDIAYEEQGSSFLKILIEHFVQYHFPKSPCVIIKDALPLIKFFKSKKIDWLFDEYFVDFSEIINKNKKKYKLIIVPFEFESDILPFASQLSLISNLKIILWRGKNFSCEIEE